MDLLHTMSKLPQLQVAFMYESKDKKAFSKDATLSQDILRYCLLDEAGISRTFKFFDLAKWLLKNNDYFRTYYSGDKSKTSITNRIGSRRREIQGCLDKVVEHKMVEIKGMVPGDRNKNQLTPLYCFTLKGNFYALFNSMHGAEKNKFDDVLVRIIQLMRTELAKSDLAGAVFFTRVLGELEKKEAPADFLPIPALVAPAWTDNVKVPFLDILMLSAKLRLGNAEPYETAFQNAFRGLDRETKKLLLLQFKLDLEHQYLLAFSDRKWERERLDNFANIDKAIIPLFCNSCGAKFTRLLKLVVFLGFAKVSDNRIRKNKTRCPECASEDTYLPVLGANKTWDNKLIIG
jgi:hypothetical protein